MKISKQEVTLVDVMGSDDSVVNAARVSFSKVADQFTKDQNEKLICYLAKHNHWSPFAHAFASFRIKAPIFVARQLVKHQVGLAWNEVSRRYVQEEPEFFLPSSWRSAPGVDKKQGSGEDLKEQGEWNLALMDIAVMSLSLYNTAIKEGMAPEQARMFLPTNTMTEWIWSGSLAAFSRVCKLRLDSHAQQETQEIASSLQELLMPLFPVSWKALQNV